MQLTRETIQHDTEAAWLASRAVDLTSTECAALFGVGVYDNMRTPFQLHHIKAGSITPEPFVTNDRVKWGNRLEAAIAAGVAEDHGLVVVPFKTYMRIPELRMGSSFDFKVVGKVPGYTGHETAARNMFDQFGEGVLEIKNVDGLQFRRAWSADGEIIEAPPHIELQAAHQLEVAGLNWGMIAPLVGGNQPHVIIRERDEKVGDAIRLAVAEFWNRVKHGTPPAPDFLADAGAIARLLVNNDGSTADMADNMRLLELCIQRRAASDQIKAAEELKDAATAEILTMIGPAKKVFAAGGFTISAGTTAGSTFTVERKPFRALRLTQKAV